MRGDKDQSDNYYLSFLASSKFFQTVISIDDLSEKQYARFKKFDCDLSKTQIDLIYALSGVLVLALKLVFGLFCFNMWLFLDPKNNGITYIEFK